MINHARKGFTLIELLAGMTILTVMVLFLTKVFTDSTNTWALGTKRVEANLSGRTAIEYMSRELAGAIFDGNLTMKLESDKTNILGYASDQIYFVTTDQKAQIGASSGDLYRQIKAVSYKISHMKHPDYRKTGTPQEYLSDRFRIMRAGLENFTDTDVKGIYTNSTWWKDYSVSLSFQEVVMENVRAVDFWVYDRNGNIKANFDSSADGPPAWIDIVVEALPDADATRLALLSDDNAQWDYADRVARRYFNRVYFHHTQGYVLAQ